MHIVYAIVDVYASAKPQSLAISLFTDASTTIIGFMLHAKLDTNSLVVLVSFCA